MRWRWWAWTQGSSRPDKKARLARDSRGPDEPVVIDTPLSQASPAPTDDRVVHENTLQCGLAGPHTYPINPPAFAVIGIAHSGVRARLPLLIFCLII